ncbi:MAG TPA: 6-phosphogluconolactonase [Caulobacteraceae bacterium]|jgi:6-phosphogluconolactonase|nr:6-phosphogluconolactonase [Caulobacteraceae bacterium]
MSDIGNMGDDDHLFDDRPSLFAALAMEITVRLTEAVTARGRASLVATGGTTPGPLYDALSAEPAPWDKVEIALTDERWVEPDSDDSNEGLVRRRLLRDRAAAAELFGLKTLDLTPADAEAKVNRALASMTRPFDLVILGMGEDGHIASLFPHAPELKRALEAGPDELVCAVDRPEAAGASARMSLTLPALLGSRWIVILIEGQAKLDVIRQARQGDDVAELPVRAVLNQSEVPVEVWWAP